MRLTLCAIGSRGDVAPLLALGRVLVENGSSVVVAAPPEFSTEAAEAGLDFCSVAPEFIRYFEETAAAMGSPVRFMSAVGRGLRIDPYDDLEKLFAITDGSDALIAAGMPYGAPHVAEALGLPYRFVAYCPQVYPSSFHPPATGAAPHPWKLPNLLSWRSLEWFFDRNLERMLNSWRRDHGLPPTVGFYDRMVGRSGERLLAADDHVAPLPDDVAGTTCVSAIQPLIDDSLPEEVEDFLASGAPPVYVGFGSMPATDAASLLDEVLATAAELKVRAMVPATWAESANRTLPGDCLAIGHVSHARLFPRLAAIVHHGGAGTTHSAARAGVPQVVVPHLLDQYYWGHRVHQLGIGPKPPSYRRLSRRHLASALGQTLGSGEMTENARALARRLVGRDGAAELADVLRRDPFLQST